MAKNMSAPRSLEFVRTFVNSLDIAKPEHDPFLDTEGASAWLGAHGLPQSSIGTKEIAELRDLREAIRTELLAHTGEGDVDMTWPRLARYLSTSHLSMTSDHPGRVSLKPTATDGFGQIKGLLTARIYDAIRSGEWKRLKACRKHNCLFAFYDRSKNGSGTWCDMAVCGNRVKARRRRAKERAASD